MLPAGAVHPSAGQEVTGRLEVKLKMKEDSSHMILGLKAKACIRATCLFDKPVFEDTEIPGKNDMRTQINKTIARLGPSL